MMPVTFLQFAESSLEVLATGRIVAGPELARYGIIEHMLDALLHSRSGLVPYRREYLLDVSSLDVVDVQRTDDGNNVIPHGRVPLLPMLLVAPCLVVNFVIGLGARLECRCLHLPGLLGQPFLARVDALLQRVDAVEDR